MKSSRIHRLTNADVISFKPQDKDYAKNDGGGLYLFIRNYGEKEWFFRFTSPITQKRHKTSLGRYPDTSLKAARKSATDKRALIDKGLDPMIEKNEEQRAKSKKHKSTTEKERHTVKMVFDEWKQAELQNRKDNGEETKRAFKKDVFPIIGNIPVSEVSRQDIKNVLARPLGRKSKRMANRLLSDLKQLFAYIDDEELTVNDPTRRMFKSRVGGKETPRERFFNKEERKLLVKILPSSGLPNNYQHAIWIMLATCCRVDELSRAKWEHLNFKNRTFTIPKEHAKNGKKHRIYLSDFALKYFKELHKTKSSDWVYPNRNGDGPIHRQTITKHLADHQRKKPLRGRTTKHETLKLPGGRWTAHDLRRTGATIMQELGIMPYIVKKCLNQTLDDTIMETYQLADLTQEKKRAFELLGEDLEKQI